jgi:hypothetical protein
MQTTIALNLLDPSSWTGQVVVGLIIGLLLLLVAAFWHWLSIPFKWWRKNKTLHQLIRNRREFVLVYQPQTNFSKTVIFMDGGQIGEGKNNNEHTWRIKRGCLEFLNDDGKVFNRFKFDRDSDRLRSTNDPDIRALFGQYLVPQFRDPGVRSKNENTA